MMRTLFIVGSFLCSSSHAGKSSDMASVAIIDSYMKSAVNGLLDMYVDDCKTNEEAHGYYGAVFQPCNFEFLESTGGAEGTSAIDACSDENTVQLLKTAPVNWFLNLTQQIEEFDFKSTMEDGSSMDKVADFAKELVLWPDQCVGVLPRCYAVNDERIRDVMEIIFEENGFPDTATHVSVDCRSDAVELSRVAYGFTSGLGKSSTTIVMWLITVVLLTLVLSCYCCLCCFRVCCCSGRERGGDRNSLRRRRPRPSKYSQIASAEVIDDSTESSRYSDSEFGSPKKTSL